MNQQQAAKLTINWLSKKRIQSDNGIIIAGTRSLVFEAAIDFVETLDDTFKTPATYYQVFPEESAIHFFDTLRSELVSKLGEHKLDSRLPLSKIIELADLKIVIIDKFYLYSTGTLSNIVDFFASCQVNLILIAAEQELKNSPLLSHPEISQWDKIFIDCQHESLPTTC